jgi:hypothetical protein
VELSLELLYHEQCPQLKENRMPSPFPGMNPYLEQDDAWHDFHERFCPLVAELLTAQVRPNYIVKIDEHVYIHELSEEVRRLVGRSDVQLARSENAVEPRAGMAVLEAPFQVRLPDVDVERLSRVEVRDRHSRQLVTVIELLSPSNKQPGPDREQYLVKRGQFQSSPVRFVEIDLLRGGPRLPLERLPECDYYALVSRVETRPEADLWPVGLRERLPRIPIPLRPPHPDAHLDLQEILNHIYDAAGYEDYIYDGEPQPRLESSDATWAEQFRPRRP